MAKLLQYKMKKNIYNTIAIISFSILTLYTLFNKRELINYTDETIYMSNVSRLEEYGLSKRFFIEYNGAAGPLYTFVHYVFKPLTGLKLPYTRYINIVFLILVILLLNYTYFLVNRAKHTSFAWQIMALPTTAITAGLALTELPAMFFLWLGIVCLLLFEQKDSYLAKWVLLFAAAFLLGISMLGRQVYIVVLVPLFIYFIQRKIEYRYLIFFFITTLILPLSLFYMWGGLLATHDRAIIETQLAPNHVVLAFGYSFLFILFLEIEYLQIGFWIKQFKFLLIAFLVCITINIFLLKLDFLPNKALLFRIIPDPEWQSRIGFLCSSVIIFMSAYFIMVFLINAWQQRYNAFLLFCNTSFFLLLGTCIKIAHVFGSRYVFQAMPFLLFAFPNRSPNNRYGYASLILGFLLGIISLHLTK